MSILSNWLNRKDYAADHPIDSCSYMNNARQHQENLMKAMQAQNAVQQATVMGASVPAQDVISKAYMAGALTGPPDGSNIIMRLERVENGFMFTYNGKRYICGSVDEVADRLKACVVESRLSEGA